MPSTSLTFASSAEHRTWLAKHATLPEGFKVGTAQLMFNPREAPKQGKMNLTLLVLDSPTPTFGGKFTRNAFPGAPVIVGRGRMTESLLSAVVINTKVANVCAPGGVESAERICAEVAGLLKRPQREIIPCSTGVIGWRLPVEEMLSALPLATEALQGKTLLPAAEAIMTTDLYPKLRRVDFPQGGSLVGIAKGAGMIEPCLATMLVFLLTDVQLPRSDFRMMLDEAVEHSFQNITVDGDTSDSDTVLALSSNCRPPPSPGVFQDALRTLCRDLAEDVVRNGEGVHHVIRVVVDKAPTVALARGIGKAVVNSPLFQCAVNGNDPNVGRLACALGKHIGIQEIPVDVSKLTIQLGGELIFKDTVMHLTPEVERRLSAHLRGAELYASLPPPDGLSFKPPLNYPPHERSVEIRIDLGCGNATCEVLGADRSHEYITENADYRS